MEIITVTKDNGLMVLNKGGLYESFRNKNIGYK